MMMEITMLDVNGMAEIVVAMKSTQIIAMYVNVWILQWQVVARSTVGKVMNRARIFMLLFGPKYVIFMLKIIRGAHPQLILGVLKGGNFFFKGFYGIF